MRATSGERQSEKREIGPNPARGSPPRCVCKRLQSKVEQEVSYEYLDVYTSSSLLCKAIKLVQL